MTSALVAIPAFKLETIKHLVSYEKLPLPGMLVVVPYPLNALGALVTPDQLEDYRLAHQFDFPQCFHAEEAILVVQTRGRVQSALFQCGVAQRTSRCAFKVNILNILGNPDLTCSSYKPRADHAALMQGKNNSDVSMASFIVSDTDTSGSEEYTPDVESSDSWSGSGEQSSESDDSDRVAAELAQELEALKGPSRSTSRPFLKHLMPVRPSKGADKADDDARGPLNKVKQAAIETTQINDTQGKVSATRKVALHRPSPLRT
ncbi:hypothetical protein BKA70DRAFT_1233298 [Coprinopsis sp. MPI-PUGE-AT-0042]|nr:hypothetical protein BKA70DRAFT_1233298 [Coprinopsis sp. MPI-PUGE-AT-0042]